MLSAVGNWPHAVFRCSLVLPLAVSAACSSGGSESTPPEAGLTTIAFSAASATSSEVGGAVSITIRLTTSASPLASDVTVDVSDALTGSATSGVDYVVFAPQTVTFSAGAVSGATQSVLVIPIDDSDVEASETVVLTLSAPTGDTQLGLQSTFTLTISDDDGGGAGAFVASEGSTGVEHAVAHNSTLDLGSLAVGLGPSTGTKLRVLNAGGQPIDIDAPRLTGANSNDFVISIDSAPLSGHEFLALGAEGSASPLIARANSEGPGLGLELDAARLAALPASGVTLVHGFPAPGLGEVTLALRRRPLPIAADAVLAIDGVVQPGGPAALVQGLSIWTGTLLELEGSHVFLALGPDSAQGFIELPLSGDRYLHIVSEAPATADSPARVRVVREQELAAMGVELPSLCGGALEVPGESQHFELDSLPPPTANLSAPECRLAIETDYQLFQKFGDSQALTSYVTQLIAAASNQYFVDVQTTLAIAYLGVYTDSSDPWTAQDSGGSASNVLDQFRSAWSGGNWPVSANLAHFISGANLGGGVAYVNVLCNQSFGFGVSGNISGNINWGSWTGAPAHFTWDFVVVAHELGHNFGSGHTHSYCPPLDQCYTNCNGSTSCAQGTIMSYCHTCGGMNAIDLRFHPVTANIMRGAVNSSCLGEASLAGGDWVQYNLRFNPLTAAGARNATLEFAHNAANQPQPFRVQLVGVAQ